MRKLLLVALLLGTATPAFANKCWVREYVQLGIARAGDNPQVAQEAGTDQTALDFSGGHAESAAFASGTKFVRLICDAQASFLFGAAPVAANTNSFIPAGLPEYFGVLGGNKVSVVANP